MSLWTWAQEAYARPGAAQAFLDLQDDYRQSVPYLIWAAWAAQTGRNLTDEQLNRGLALAERWEGAATGPLRQARRALKPDLDGLPDAPRLALRHAIQALELQAERIVLDALEPLAPPPTNGPFPIEDALAKAAAACAVQASASALARLADALS